jgi:hypothetical protein
MTTFMFSPYALLLSVNTLKSALFDGDSDLLPVIITYLAWENFASCSVRGLIVKKFKAETQAFSTTG